MTDPETYNETVTTTSHSAGEPDPITDEGGGSDVGGPATQIESSSEQALGRETSAVRGDDYAPGDQAQNPL